MEQANRLPPMYAAIQLTGLLGIILNSIYLNLERRFVFLDPGGSGASFVIHRRVRVPPPHGRVQERTPPSWMRVRSMPISISATISVRVRSSTATIFSPSGKTTRRLHCGEDVFRREGCGTNAHAGRVEDGVGDRGGSWTR
jgi:hypothetical protein